MKSGRCLALGVAVTLGLMSSLTMSADIPQDVLKSPNSLNAIQQRSVDAYVDEWVSALLKGDEDTIGDARLHLLEPLQKGGSSTFNLAYSASVSNLLAKAMQSESVQVRLNAMIVTSKLIDSSALNLIKQGLNDPSPACRIWGAKAAYEFAVANRLTADDEAGLLKPLEGVLGRDSAPEVLEQILHVMAEFKSDGAVKATLDALNQRLSLFASDPKLAIRADLDGLRSVYQRMVQSRANGQTIRQDVLRLLGTVAYRHVRATVHRIDVAKSAINLKVDDKKMIDLTDQILPWVTKQLNEGSTPPAKVLPLISLNKVPEALLLLEDWKHFLIAPPLNYPAKGLEVTGAD